MPELQDRTGEDEPSKVVTLKKAAKYLRFLCKTNLILQKEIDGVAERNVELRQRLELAKRAFYSQENTATV